MFGSWWIKPFVANSRATRTFVKRAISYGHKPQIFRRFRTACSGFNSQTPLPPLSKVWRLSTEPRTPCVRQRVEPFLRGSQVLHNYPRDNNIHYLNEFKSTPEVGLSRLRFEFNSDSITLISLAVISSCGFIHREQKLWHVCILVTEGKKNKINKIIKK